MLNMQFHIKQQLAQKQT